MIRIHLQKVIANLHITDIGVLIDLVLSALT